jgi:hypothetical protein
MKRITPFPQWFLWFLLLLGALYLLYVLAFVADPVLKIAFSLIAVTAVVMSWTDLRRAARIKNGKNRLE